MQLYSGLSIPGAAASQALVTVMKVPLHPHSSGEHAYLYGLFTLHQNPLAIQQSLLHRQRRPRIYAVMGSCLREKYI